MHGVTGAVKNSSSCKSWHENDIGLRHWVECHTLVVSYLRLNRSRFSYALHELARGAAGGALGQLEPPEAKETRPKPKPHPLGKAFEGAGGTAAGGRAHAQAQEKRRPLGILRR